MRFSDLVIDRNSSVMSSARFTDVAAFFGENPTATMLVVCNDRRVPLGVISQIDFQQRITSPFGHSLYSSKRADEILSEAFPRARITDDVAETIESLQPQFLRSTGGIFATGLVLVDEENCFVGAIGPRTLFQALLQINQQTMSNLRDEISERKRIEAEIKHLAERDPLTNLLNRRSFRKSVQRATDASKPVYCAFIDLDRFKQVNDQMGHAVGDEVLCEIGRRLEAFAWTSQSGRLGGDEFSTLFSATDEHDLVLERVESLHQSLTSPIETSSGLISVGASIGLARFPDQAEDVSILMNAADRAMLRAKSGGGGLVMFDPHIDLVENEADSLARDVSIAVMRKEFQPALQPIFDRRGKRILGREMLARWPHSGREPAPAPDVFIPIIERLGLSKPVFLSLLEQAADQLPDDKSFLSVNLSAASIADDGFIRELMSRVEALHMDLSRLEIEITEGVAFRNLDASLANLERLRERQVGVTLDDFGTGYSALSHVDRLPITKIKLDRTLIARLGENGRAEKIVRAVVAMCRELDLTCCAEGVETQAQLETLQSIGCDQFQGFLLGRPEIGAPDQSSTAGLQTSRARRRRVAS